MKNLKQNKVTSYTIEHFLQQTVRISTIPVQDLSDRQDFVHNSHYSIGCRLHQFVRARHHRLREEET
eukprot:752485-Hanusia_phi.AAC.1